MKKVLSSMLIAILALVAMIEVTHAGEAFSTPNDHIEQSNQNLDFVLSCDEEASSSEMNCCDECCASTCLHHITHDPVLAHVPSLPALKKVLGEHFFLVTQFIDNLKQPPRSS